MDITSKADITSEASEPLMGLLVVQRLQEKMLKIASDAWLQRNMLGAEDPTISIKERGK
jgi:hypothetical protein|tara:strand:+ start:381 stop:557 length:177 start_codon:yes stop_codon:yes gene_type:complete